MIENKMMIYINKYRIFFFHIIYFKILLKVFLILAGTGSDFLIFPLKYLWNDLGNCL